MIFFPSCYKKFKLQLNRQYLGFEEITYFYFANVDTKRGENR